MASMRKLLSRAPALAFRSVAPAPARRWHEQQNLCVPVPVLRLSPQQVAAMFVMHAA
jgi:hypothetical protein